MLSISSLLNILFVFVVFFTTKFVQFHDFALLWFLQRTKNRRDRRADSMLVELPDTASGSESPHGHHSTCIVSCFVLAKIVSCRKRN